MMFPSFRNWGWMLCLAAFIAQPATAALTTEQYSGREALVYVPQHLPPAGQRALVVVLHGGMGNADRIAGERSESGMNLNEQAEHHGFIVAYLNGTPVARFLGSDKLGWNAGECCGQPALKKTDDVGYIRAAVGDLQSRYGVDPARAFGMGHSNGAMMLQRMMCETDLFRAAIPVSGPLETGVAQCPAARGKTILAIHGTQDENVPINGGVGSKGFSKASFLPAAQSQKIFQQSGASYTLQPVEAEHRLDTVDAAIRKAEGITLAEKAVRFFGLDK